MVKEGAFASLPPRAIGATEWNDLARKARKRPGQPMLAASQVRYSTIKGLMQRKRPPFIESDGRVKVNMRNSSLDEDGVRYGEVWMTWLPNEIGDK